MDISFKTKKEISVEAKFLKDGYLIQPVDNQNLLSKIQKLVASQIASYLSLDFEDPSTFLNDIHKHLDPNKLNEARLSVFKAINSKPWLRPAYFRLAANPLQIIAGNELAMQRRINLSIQLPNDNSSILDAHTDTLSGDSPYEIVQWLPLVDCYKTKTMFILPPKKNAEIHERLSEFRGIGLDALSEEIRNDLIWLNVPYNSVLIFNQNLFHGNVVNVEKETRWSMNCRFKGVFTPYADKRLGEFFEPITLRPASRIGLDYEYPKNFEDDPPNAK
tara:strand:+ start:955 stop:1779 length:825 start_codon:yes stop_codon:yes gene_type:complete